MDFAKAFNKASHTRLLHKLCIYGTDPEACGWSRSCLCGRTQHVLVDGEAYKEVEITSRVPQCSVLGPIFFLIYMNGMAECTKCSPVRLFADNTILYLTPTAKTTAKNSKKTFKRWRSGGADWLIEFHSDKWFVTRITRKKTNHRYPYTLHGQILAEEINTEYLWVTLADNMTWNTHIEQTVTNGNRKLGFLKRNLKTNNLDIMSCAYKTLVRSTLEYCSTVWDPHTAKADLLLEMV